MKRTHLLIAGLLMASTAHAQEPNRGIGDYPGDPRENFAPSLQPDPSYRNVALRRPAYASSSYDYNLTAQLVTDGIVEARPPRTIATATSALGVLDRHAREWLVDGNWVSTVDLPGPSGWVQLALLGGQAPLEIDRLAVEGRVQATSEQPENWKVTALGSDDAQAWTTLGWAAGMARPGGDLAASIAFRAPARSRYYRLVFDNPRAALWRIGEVKAYSGDRQVQLGGPHHFTSAWASAGRGEEWVRVDLGAPCSIDRLALHWVRRPAAGAIEISETGEAWQPVHTLGAAPPDGSAESIGLRRPVRARHVRVRMTRPAGPDGVVLSELEVFGRGGLVARPAPAPPVRADGRVDLAGGRWRVERDSQVSADGATLSRAGFDDAGWVVATVPGTVLTSYYNAGALPDPNFGDNQLQVSDAFFHADFWYRTEFATPSAAAGRRLWLNFDGINWKAEVFLNGAQLGRIEGAFTRARFEVTDQLRRDAPNALAVRIVKVANPGSVKEKTYQNPDKNGGVLGADNPTYHASIGWDWIPTIRGRNTGIWNDVFLTSSGPVTIEDPLVTTVLPLRDTSRADVTLRLGLRNHAGESVSGTLRGRFGEVQLALPVTVPANTEAAVTLDPTTHAALSMASPRLWWPNGYGEPALHDVELRFETGATGGPISSEVRFEAGIRQFTYSEAGGALRLWVNGRRFVPRGGNWGFPESMLRYRGREYDIAMRYHRDMNFNMVRNWVGQNGDDELYEAADRHGIVIWQDFWLANPWDGPDPEDEPMFMRNVTDTVRRIRKHASVGLYCGRNEGYPPKTLDDAIRAVLGADHPGIHYISSSADDVASGHGPYRAMPLTYYFGERATARFHSEMGMPNIVTMDSLKQMMPAEAMWPQDRMWGLHDFCLEGAQGGSSYLERIQRNYGPVTNVEDWVALAQFVNYDGYRAMYEAQSRNRMGLLIWMSHPTWPSFVWQTYDYYFDTTAAFYGAKKASEPLHVQLNPVSREHAPFGATTTAVEVVNYSGGTHNGLAVSARVLNLDGTVAWERTAAVDSAEDSTVSPFALEVPVGVSRAHIVRLTLLRGETLISQNDYIRGLQEGDLRDLRGLPAATVETATTVERDGAEWALTTRLRNTSAQPALHVRVKPVGGRSGERILPAFSSDNYLVLLPGETRTITTRVVHADTRGETPVILVEGFNVKAVAAATGAPAGRARGAAPAVTK
jgi:hypothetical protein